MIEPFVTTRLAVQSAAVVLAALIAGCGRSDVQSYRIAKAPTGGTSEPNPHDSMMEMSPHGTASKQQLKYTVPEGWEERAAGSMRAASFVAGKGNHIAQISVVPLGGPTREVDNVNLWRGQVELPPLSADEVSRQGASVQVGPEQGRMFEMVSANPITDAKIKVRTVAVILPRADANWFFKIIGEDAVVSEQKQAFVEFLKSVSFAASEPAGIVSSKVDGGRPVETGTRSDLPQWSVPSAWKEVAPGQMLLAKFLIEGEAGARADVNVSMLVGAGGGLLANANRWRGQLGLQPIDQAEFDQSATSITAGEGKVILVEMTGTDGRTGQPSRIMGAMVPLGDKTWFYKLMGDAGVVAREKEAFVQFVQTAGYPHAR